MLKAFSAIAVLRGSSLLSPAGAYLVPETSAAEAEHSEPGLSMLHKTAHCWLLTLSFHVWCSLNNPPWLLLHFRVTFSHSCSVLQLLTKLAAMPPDSKGTKENEHCARDLVFSRPWKGSLDLSKELYCACFQQSVADSWLSSYWVVFILKSRLLLLSANLASLKSFEYQGFPVAIIIPVYG